MVWYRLVWFCLVSYGFVLFGMVLFGMVCLRIFQNVLECSRMFWKTPKSFMGGGWWVGGWVVCCNYSVYSGPDLLNLRQRLSWRGPGRHLELTWRWSGPKFDNLYINILTFLLKKQENFHFCFEYVKICCNCAVAVLVQEYATIIIVQII